MSFAWRLTSTLGGAPGTAPVAQTASRGAGKNTKTTQMSLLGGSDVLEATGGAECLALRDTPSESRERLQGGGRVTCIETARARANNKHVEVLTGRPFTAFCLCHVVHSTLDVNSFTLSCQGLCLFH